MITTHKEDLIGYKKVRRNGEKAIVVLLIPAGTRFYKSQETIRSLKKSTKHYSEFKLRAEKAYVLGIFGLSDMPKSFNHKGYFSASPLEYKTGEVVLPDKFSPKYAGSCAGGIHFFLNINSAINWR